jgi:hypothetical protein
MKIEKLKMLVNIICSNNTVIKGNIYINQGERTKDFINNSQGDFIAVTEAKIYTLEHYLKAEAKPALDKDVIILNKSSINWLEEA